METWGHMNVEHFAHPTGSAGVELLQPARSWGAGEMQYLACVSRQRVGRFSRQSGCLAAPRVCRTLQLGDKCARVSGVEVEAELVVHGFAGVCPALLGPHVEEEMHRTLQEPAAAGGGALLNVLSWFRSPNATGSDIHNRPSSPGGW
jgi:hypothetical protein